MTEGPIRPASQDLLLREDPEILLFPQPDQLINQARKRAANRTSSAERIADEYLSILVALSEAYDPSRIFLVKTDLIVPQQNAQGRVVFKTISPEDPPGYRSIRMGGQESRTRPEEWQISERIFLRDLFTGINGEIFFVDPHPSPDVVGNENVIISSMGEGGKVLNTGKSVIVAEDLWRNPNTKKDIEMLKKRGYKVAFLPHVDPRSQPEEKRNFLANHIDGHVALITGRDGKPYIVYARSYNAGKPLQHAANFLGARLVPVNDRDLPPLAFNFLQLPDGKVVITSGEDTSVLTDTVSQIVGSENVITTMTPIVETPSLSKGSIRCMVNIAPLSVIQRFNPTPSI